MIIFNVDLDNTLIYSYRHNIGDRKICVELYEGREVSFMTDHTQELLKKISKRVRIVPVTTRTVEQYRRVRLGLDAVPYALVCNGGVLLADGREDEQWYIESLRLVLPCAQELEKAECILTEDAYRCYDVKNIKHLFLFTKSSQPDVSAGKLRESLDASLVDVCQNGSKVYVVPKKLNKGAAALRLKKKLKANKVLAAGDSAFDISMLECADLSFAPAGLAFGGRDGSRAVRVDDGESTGVFSDLVLEYVERMVLDI